VTSTRTQIYLTDRQRRRLDEICRRRGITLAEAVRDAVDAWVEHGVMSCDEALDVTYGRAPDLDVPSRDEWNRDPSPPPPGGAAETPRGGERA